jgi:hypothetical protein
MNPRLLSESITESRAKENKIESHSLELEGRRLLAALTVSNTNASGAESLAAAIWSADSNDQANTIMFEPSAFSTRQSIILGAFGRGTDPTAR